MLILATLAAGCPMFMTPPDVEVKDVSIVGLDSKAVEIELFFSVTNRNAFPLKLNGYNYDLKVMALPLAKGGAREFMEFKPGSSTDVRLPVRVVFRNLYEIMKRGPDPDNLPYTLNAGLEIDSPFGATMLPVEKSGIFKVPERYRPGLYLKQFRNILGGLME